MINGKVNYVMFMKQLIIKKRLINSLFDFLIVEGAHIIFSRPVGQPPHPQILPFLWISFTAWKQNLKFRIKELSGFKRN